MDTSTANKIPWLSRFSNTDETPDDEMEDLIKTMNRLGKGTFIANLEENIVSCSERITENKDKFSKLATMRKISPESLEPIFDDRMAALRKIIESLFCNLGQKKHILSMINTLELFHRPNDPSAAPEKFDKDPRLVFIDETLAEYNDQLQGPVGREGQARLGEWIKTLGVARNEIVEIAKMHEGLLQAE